MRYLLNEIDLDHNQVRHVAEFNKEYEALDFAIYNKLSGWADIKHLRYEIEDKKAHAIISI